MTTNKPLYTPEEVGSGQWGICAKCGLGPTAEGHDGCLGTLPYPVMNACCGHGNDRQAYVQFWGGDGVKGAEAIALQAKMIADREADAVRLELAELEVELEDLQPATQPNSALL